MEFNYLIKTIVKQYKIVSIIGLAKNVSKTTTLNHIIQVLKGEYKLGLTSIGRDGEKYDAITSLPKPRIHVEEGTYLATAQKSLENGEVKSKLVKKTGINTPMGEIQIVRTLGSGLVELAGPSIDSELKQVCDDLLHLGCDIVLIDGAFDRRSYASPLISQATILSTGASVSKKMNEVIELTRHTINLLGVEKEQSPLILNLANTLISKTKIGIIDEDNSTKTLSLPTALGSVEEILHEISPSSRYLVINGAITNKFLEEFMKKTDYYKNIKILVPDATKLFLNKRVFEQYLKKGGTIRVLNQIRLLILTINPTSPLGYQFNKSKFLSELEKGISIPIYDLGPSKY
jgi:hypothetical protein